MELLVLEAKIRNVNGKAKELRAQNLIPAVCYGRGFENRSLEVGYQAFRKVFKETGSSQVLNLSVDGQKIPVLVHEVGYNPMTDRFDHVDFLQIDMKVMVTAMVPVEVEGLSPAIKNFNAVVTIVKHEIEVKCLPMDIPHEIKVDVSKLENPGDSFHISDLKLGSKVEILDDPEETLVSISVVEEFKENEVVVPEDLKAEPVAEGADAADAPKEEAAAPEKKED
jgi:large subunit ribosomal protein L25